jgi:arsenate reductase (thioredoxin)
MIKKTVLFICEHNASRSQMAEAFLLSLAGEKFEVESAGLEPGSLNPLVVEAMREIGIDISQNKTKSVFDFYKQGKRYVYVITVCDESQSRRCPIFPGITQRLHWSFEDPSKYEGSREEKLQKIRTLRDDIQARIIEWINSF